MKKLERLVRQSPYSAYSYSYPHKSAYRAFETPCDLTELWSREKRDSLFLYIHIPFCGKRCGFCNLFSMAKPDQSMQQNFITTLKRQAEVMAGLTGDFRFSRFALGGGTPTYLDSEALETVLDITETVMGVDLLAVPGSVEASPDSMTPEKLNLLKTRGIDRISLGVQSFIDSETISLARPQKREMVDDLIERIKAMGFPVLNLDLIYGIPGQTSDSWASSIEQAVLHDVQEIYIYPLYIRPLTGLGKSSKLKQKEAGDFRAGLYHAGRKQLLDSGYTQVSMRMFKKTGMKEGADEPVYCCQEDGMIGLGPGARSYTQNFHYSSEYAVGRDAVASIVDAYCTRSREQFALAPFGIRLNDGEQKRRYIVKSVLTMDGLNRLDYKNIFGSEPMDDFPQLAELVELGLGSEANERIILNEKGISFSDTIGPWLISPEVRELMDGSVIR